MFVEASESFVTCLIIIITFKFFDHNVKISFGLVVNSRNNRRIVVLSFLFK